MGGNGAYRRRPGDPIVRRDVWRGRPVVGWGGIVVSDTDDLLVFYMPEGGPLGFPPEDFFGGPHPWSGKDRWKDDEQLESWIERGRWTSEEVKRIRAEGDRISAELEAGRRSWSEDWAAWEPDPSWPAPELPAGWERAR